MASQFPLWVGALGGAIDVTVAPATLALALTLQTPEISITAEFGYHTEGDSFHNHGGSVVYADRHTYSPAEDGVLDSIFVYCRKASAGTIQARFALYDASDDSLVAETVEIDVIFDSGVYHWYEAAVVGDVDVFAAKNYYFAFKQSDQNYVKCDTGTLDHWYDLEAYANDWVDPGNWTVESGKTNKYSIYATYTLSAADQTIYPVTLALALTQQAPAIIAGTIITPDTFALALTQETSTVLFPIQTILADVLELVLIQQVSNIVTGIIIEPVTFELALSLQTSTVVISVTITPDTLALALTLQIPDVVIPGITVMPDTFTLALTLQTPVISVDLVTILPDTFELEADLLIPIAIDDKLVAPDTFVLALTQETPTISIDYTAIPTTFALALTLRTSHAMSGYAEMTPTMHAALIDSYSGGAWLWLVEIAIPGYELIRLARNTEDIVYSGLTYTANNFDVGLAPLSGDGSVPRYELRVAQDTDYTLEDKINATQGACGGVIKIIRAHEDFLTYFITELEQVIAILSAGSDTAHVSFTLGMPDPLLRKIPLRRYSSKKCPYALPGLFKGIECGYVGADTTCTGKLTDCDAKGNVTRWGGELGLDPNVAKV